MALKSILGIWIGSVILLLSAKITKCSRIAFILILPRSTHRLVYFPVSVGESLLNAKKMRSVPILRGHLPCKIETDYSARLYTRKVNLLIYRLLY